MHGIAHARLDVPADIDSILLGSTRNSVGKVRLLCLFDLSCDLDCYSSRILAGSQFSIN